MWLCEPKKPFDLTVSRIGEIRLPKARQLYIDKQRRNSSLLDDKFNKVSLSLQGLQMWSPCFTTLDFFDLIDPTLARACLRITDPSNGSRTLVARSLRLLDLFIWMQWAKDFVFWVDGILRYGLSPMGPIIRSMVGSSKIVGPVCTYQCLRIDSVGNLHILNSKSQAGQLK